MNINEILQFAQKRKKILIALFFIFNFLSVYFLLSIKEEYKSTSYLQINDFTQNSSNDSFGVSFLQEANLTDSAALASQYLNTKDFIYKAIEKYDLKSHFFPRKEELNEEDFENLYELLKKKISFAPVKDRESIFIFTFQSYESSFSQTILNNLITDLNNDLSQQAVNSSETRINYVLSQLEQSTNKNLINSFSKLLDEEVKKNTLASAMPNSYIFEIIGIPDKPVKRSYPGSRIIYLILLNVVFVFMIIFFVLFKDAYRGIFNEKED